MYSERIASMNTSSLTFIIDGTPMPKQSFKIGKNVNFTPIKTKNHIMSVTEQIKRQLPENFQVIDKPVIVNYYFLYEFPKYMIKKKPFMARIKEILDKNVIPGLFKPNKPDADNLVKLYNDCLNKHVIKDDSLIVGYSGLYKMYSSIPGVIINIDTIENNDLFELYLEKK